jgi:biotin transporter BioY
LRHFTVRLWTSLLTGSLVMYCIGFPVVGRITGRNRRLLGSSGLCPHLLFPVGGWFGNTLGMRWVDRLTREAGIWERAGNFKAIRNCF